MKMKGTRQSNDGRVVPLLPEMPLLISVPIFRLSRSVWCPPIESSLSPPRIERCDRPATECEGNEECEDYAEHADDCAYLQWIERNKSQRHFIERQIEMMVDQVHRERDPEELALLLGKIACFESELDVLQKRFWEVRDADSDYRLPRDVAQNIFDRELCDFHSEKAKFGKHGDHSESAYMFYAQALSEVGSRLHPPVAVSIEPDRRQKPTEPHSTAPVKRHQVPSTPAKTKKTSTKPKNKNRSISIVVKY